MKKIIIDDHMQYEIQWDMYKMLMMGEIEKDITNPYTNEPIYEDIRQGVIRYFESIGEYDKCSKLQKL
jgi:hypothetical protein